jgi:hypothetical protein
MSSICVLLTVSSLSLAEYVPYRVRLEANSIVCLLGVHVCMVAVRHRMALVVHGLMCSS